MTTDDPIQTAFSEKQPHRYSRGEAIIGPGDPKDYVFLIDSGYVKASSISTKKHEHVLFFYGPGEVFPWRYLFETSEGDYYDETIYSALTDTSVIALPIETMRQRMRSDVDFTLALLHQQHKLYSRVILNLHINTSQQRVVYRLLVLADQFGRYMKDHTIIDFPLTQQEFADTVQLSRETTGKLLNDLEADGNLIWGRKNILIYTRRLEKLLVKA
jgi:CRP/FNR family transcriptional regulator